ncbi:MAG: bifunctional metallophosphatase/5'-nucleotidase [Actinobacteria bacterium]|nr:bifunctional metallophosphatase/5'-nucleotidase [Actinomycetota bacterium]
MNPSSARAGSRSRFRLGFAAFAVAAAAIGVSTAPSAEAATPVVINLVTVNDFHGRIERSAPSGGIAALSTAVQQIRATNPNTVFAAAGDMIGASTFTSFIAQDVPTIESLNAAGLQVSAVGNHEFDQGYSDLVNRVLPLANWEYLGANVETTDAAPELPEYWTQTFEGITIGFVGAVTDELPSLVSPAGIANLVIETPLAAANRVANQLSDLDPANGEADIVVLLVHEGAATPSLASATDPNSRFGQLVNGANANIDAIVSGHTHLAYNHVINGRPVISSGQYGEKFSNMTISVDPVSKAFTMNNVINDMFTIVPPVPPSTTPTSVPNYADDPLVTPIVTAAVANAKTLGSVQLGKVTADFNRARQNPIVGPPANPTPENRGGESTIGNFVADVQLWSANQEGFAQIAFMNPGGIRANITLGTDGGIVTYAEAAGVQPFANTLITMDLTGAQVKQVLEQQWQPAGASRPILHLGINKELNVTYDPNGAAGSRVTGITLSGVPVDPAATYRVVVNSFLAAGGDNFLELANGTNKTDTGKVDLQSMVDWFAANLTATPDLAQRQVGVNTITPNAMGELLTVNLSSLEFSAGEAKAGTASVTLAGAPFGSTALDPTIVDTTDEIGRGTVVAAVPPTVYGWQQLGVTTALGTNVSQSVFLKAPSSVRVDADRRAKRGQKYELEVAVRSPIAVSGSFTVAVDGVVLGTFPWAPKRDGETKVKVRLPRTLTRGAHTVTVAYGGSATVLSSATSYGITVR